MHLDGIGLRTIVKTVVATNATGTTVDDITVSALIQLLA
jgi:hypothetical protein